MPPPDSWTTNPSGKSPTERDNHHINLTRRVRCSLSCLQRAEQDEVVDGRFVFLWIALNAAYITESMKPNNWPSVLGASKGERHVPGKVPMVSRKTAFYHWCNLPQISLENALSDAEATQPTSVQPTPQLASSTLRSHTSGTA